MADEPTRTMLRRASTDARTDDSRAMGLPDDLLKQSVVRLRALALVYAFVFFFQDILGWLIVPGDEINSLDDWLPATLSITVALLVAWSTTRPSLHPKTVLRFGLAFEILGSFGIAIAEYWNVYEGLEYQPQHLDIAGLSWVAPWVMLYTVAVPARPRTALLASAASVAMVPLVLLLTMRFGGTSIVLTPSEFFTGLIFPYMLVVLMAYVGARVVYRLGSDVAHARKMGSYQLVEKLAEGGMGEVWRAEHRMLARPAIIKMIRSDVLREGDSEQRDKAVRRFTREAQVTSSLRSANTVALYDFGVSEDGMFYYVMELLDGLDLSEMIIQYGPIPAERVVHVMKQVCNSLAEAHERGLVHRDIKPANIFLCRYGREVDFVKVLDFGLVKRDGAEKTDAGLTAEHTVGGTPAFIAPEQAAGGSPVDRRADLYAAGCVAYWLLTGEFVFQGETTIQTMVMHVQETPVPPSRRTELPVPAKLEQTILHCLEKDPGRRPQSADALLEELVACESPPVWDRARAAEWWERHRPAPTA